MRRKTEAPTAEAPVPPLELRDVQKQVWHGETLLDGQWRRGNYPDKTAFAHEGCHGALSVCNSLCNKDKPNVGLAV